jgi:nucleotide-binding universal stress UspA family protein
LQAREQYENSLRIKKDVNDREGEALVGANLGVIYYYLGDYETSRRYCQEALTLAREMGARHVEGNALTNLGYTLTGLGELSEAAATFQAALDLRLALGQSNLVPQPQAGLAHVALTADDPVKALTYIEPVLAYMAENELDSAADPFRIYLAAYQTLQANEDPRATAVLRQAYTELETQGAKINDEELRRSFFENVAAHRALAAAWRSLMS